MGNFDPQPMPRDIVNELTRLHRRLSELADERAPARELWATLERIRELRAQLEPHGS